MPTLGAEINTISEIPAASLKLRSCGSAELAAMVVVWRSPPGPKNCALCPTSGSVIQKETAVGIGARKLICIPQRSHWTSPPPVSYFAPMILFGGLEVEVDGTAVMANTNGATDSPG